MPVYRYGVETTSQPDGNLFDASHPDFRSEAQQRHTPLALHDSDSNDLKLARKLAEEMINVSGAEVKVYVRTENADYDRLWDADPDPTYWNPVPMKAFFKPAPLEMELKKWGADNTNRTEIVFNHQQLYRCFGERMLRVGDVVQVPYNAATESLNPKYYRVTNATPSGNFRYNWLYLTCQAEVLTADMTVRPADASPMPFDEMAEKKGGYRES